MHSDDYRKKNKGRNTKSLTTEIEISLPETSYRPYDLESGDWFYHEDVKKEIKERFEGQPENRIIILQGNPGSGKTSTLKRIENSPGHLLGSNYIPLYLDSRDYIGRDLDDLSFSLYRDIVKKLNKRGYKVPQPDYFMQRQKKGKTLEYILLTVDNYFNKGEILILILDEFDKLLENIEAETISSLIRYFQRIEKSWKSYGLILAGDKRLVNLSNSQTINRFLEEAPVINVEEVVEKDTIKKLIIEPLKNHLVYDDEAIEKIIWYSGKNLYFQQLICYYVVRYLNEKEDNRSTEEQVEELVDKALEQEGPAYERKLRCTGEDIEQAVNRILDDKILELVYAWENKLYFEAQILVSAIADKSITEQKGDLHFLNENSLLADIFGGEINNEIEKLQTLGYVNKMKKRYFFEFPFKTPLFGKWIRKEHPFLKTIIENIENIADKINLYSLIKGIEETPENKLPLFAKKTILKIAKKWCLLTKSIIKKQTIADKKQIKLFFESLASLLNFSMKDNSKSNGNYFTFDIKNLNIGILNEAFCFIQDRPELAKEDIVNIENKATAVAEDTQAKVTLFFYFQKSEMVKNLVKKTYLNLIAIEENDLKKIIFSERPRETFRKIILSRLSLQKVSPYQTAGPAKAIFYGRNDYITRICSSTSKSFAIVGARKIGKTSLLHKIKEEPPPNTIYVFMDLDVEFSNVKNYNTFLRSLELEIQKVFGEKVDFGRFFSSKNLAKLPLVIQNLSQKEKQIVFILDEIDGLIEFDKKRDYKLMRIFRALSQKNNCQFIFAGFKELYHRRRNIENPTYNFYEEIKLTPLTREAALELITKPMESIGIQYENTEIRELILGYTGCHPNLLQFFCKHLIEKVENHNNVDDRRTIFREDIDELFDKEYEEYILDEIYMFFSDLSNINKLILILLVEQQQNSTGFPGGEPQSNTIFSIDVIRSKLIEKGIQISIDKLYQNLKNLVMRFILVDEGKNGYRFALSVFPEILRKRIDDYLKYAIIKEIKEE